MKLKKVSISLLLSGLVLSPLMANDAEYDKLLKRVDTLEKKLQEVNAAQDETVDMVTEIVDQEQFTWGGDLTINSFNYHRKDLVGIPPKEVDSDENNKMALYGNLTGSYKASEDTKVNVQLSVSKPFGGANSATSKNLDSGDGLNFGDSTVQLTQFYVTHNFTPNSWLRFGRIPTMNSLGTHLANNQTARKSIYPRTLTNQTRDGLELGKRFTDFGTFKNPTARFVFVKNSSANPFGETPKYADLKDTSAGAILTEAKLDIENMGDNLLIIGAVHAVDVTNEVLPINLGDFSIATAYFQNNHSFGSKFSYFLSATYFTADASGETITPNPDMPNMKLGMIDDSGTMILVGGRYDFDKLKIGAEFNTATKYFYAMNQININDPYNKLNTLGSAYEVYTIYDLNQNTYIKVSGISIDRDYTRTGLFNNLRDVSDGSEDDWGWGVSITTRF